MKFVDITNKRFGKLIVIERMPNTKNGSTIWKCKCDCGNNKHITGRNLRMGNSVTCGCSHNRKGKNNHAWKGYEEISGRYWRTVKKGAKERNLQVSVTIEQCWNKAIEQNKKCALSGIDLVFGKNASLDRIDSDKGYVIGNVQWVDKDINIIKSNYDEQRFIELCKQVARHKT